MEQNKTLLIIYPHWFPANLAGVQRPRLIGNYLPELGWNVRVLTVKETYFEEKPDPDFEKLFASHFDTTRVDAFPVTNPRVIGDIGLRAFYQLYKEGLKVLKSESIDFMWLPIPSFYNALLGRLLYEKTRVPYGVDYIDPWVRDISNQNNLRAKVSQWFARFLEPISIKKASLISGVSAPYYTPALERNFPDIYEKNGRLKTLFRNPNTNENLVQVAMPYGFDPNDHAVEIEGLKLPWSEIPECKPWIYAGAFLPNSHLFVDSLFQSIASLKKRDLWDPAIRLFFIGTGPYPAKRITAYAADHGIEDIVIEDRERHPFLHILNYLSKADKVMLIGSTEKHYTASKTFQCILSKRPILAILHELSSATGILKKCQANNYLVNYTENLNTEGLNMMIEDKLSDLQHIDEVAYNLLPLEEFTSYESAKKLSIAIHSIL
ncbi:glycosyltransferase family 4 protein [Robertkochia solimangrovi]|uniref:glycosyltransferase family 4 protein n=1 Tax=Robertkochia solimangrovi TaxID=2213046 RepID=UPI00117EBCA8|nr:glycosyltransferase family 4 protein [Robertkochia solimangrovi]TRZ44991.1 hypothetical protein DMZ48_04310 [Robertkochia solimangrovi]